jgi:hypothetical protein
MKTLILSSIVLASLIVGCKSSGGICCNGEAQEQPQEERFLDPVAVIDNRTIQTDLYPAIALSGARSYDRDELNQSIESWDWNITRYHYNNEIITTDPDCTIIDSGVEVNVTYENCQQATYTIAILTVTDDEGDKNTTDKNLTIPLY